MELTSESILTAMDAVLAEKTDVATSVKSGTYTIRKMKEDVASKLGLDDAEVLTSFKTDIKDAMIRYMHGRKRPREDDSEKLMKELAEMVAKNNVVFITGAGISTSAGIPAFRTGGDAVWSKYVTEMGTKKAMRRDVVKWYNDFWTPTFESAAVKEAVPTKAHKAIARITRLCPGTKVCTQNVDGLHCSSIHGDDGVEDPQLIEAHGRAGIFRCSGFDQNGKRPVGACDDSVARDKWYDNLRVDLGLTTPPMCPSCQVACAVPVALLFDEIYDAHFFFEADAWDAWFDDMDAVVFVGTSFAVELTREALRRSRHRKIPAFDINVQLAPPNVVRSDYLRHHTLLGDCQVILPRLADLVHDILKSSSQVE